MNSCGGGNELTFTTTITATLEYTLPITKSSASTPFFSSISS